MEAISTRNSGAAGLHSYLRNRRGAAARLAATLCRWGQLLLFVPLLLRAQDFTHTTNQGGITITGYTGPGGDVTVPDHIGDLPVTEIGANALSWNSTLTGVTLPYGVLGIGEEAFSCSSELAYVTIPDSVGAIEPHAFEGCLGLRGLTIPDSVTNIGLAAFCWSDLTNVALPGQVTDLSPLLFQGCLNLTNVAFPDGLVRIERLAFSYCTNLASITIPEGLKYIDGEAFEYCGLTNLTIPDAAGLTVGPNAFARCTNLATVTIGNGVTAIGGYAFGGCPALTTVSIGTGVTNVDGWAFAYCSNLTSVYFYGDAPRFGDRVLEGTDATVFHLPDAKGSWYLLFSVCPVGWWNPGPPKPDDFKSTNNGVAVTITGYTGPTGAVVIPETIGGLPVRSVGDGAFLANFLPASVTIPHTVTNIGRDAFLYCTYLTNVSFPENLTTIGQEAFAVTGLASVRIPANSTNLGAIVFHDCYNLRVVTLSRGLRQLPAGLFFNSRGLDKVVCEGDAPTAATNAFLSCFPTIYYLPGTTGWRDTFAGCPTVLWDPRLESSGPGLGVRPDGFRLNVRGTTNIPVVIEASASLGSPAWVPLHSSVLMNGSLDYLDTDRTNFPTRIYRVRSP